MMDEELRKVAKMAVQETFLALGVDTSTPTSILEAQQGFALLRNLVRLRMAFLVSLVTLAGTGVGWAIWSAVVTARAKTGG